MMGLSTAFLVATATNLSATPKTFYVDVKGNDDSGDGSKLNPWQSLHYALSQVPVNEGATIYLSAGVFVEAFPCVVPARVNIEGAGIDKTVLKSEIDDFLIKLESDPIVDGYQTLKNFKIDGQHRQLKGGIFIRGRHHVFVENISFESIQFSGLQIVASWEATKTSPPPKYLTDIEVTGCRFKNCAQDLGSWSSGCLHLGGLEGAKIHDIKIEEDEGYGIKFFSWGWFKNLKIYNADIKVPDYDKRWKADCALELWNLSDDCEIYNIQSNQWFSFVGGDKGNGSKSLTVHDCQILINRSDEQYLQAIEIMLSDGEFYNNYFENPGTFGAFAIWGDHDLSNLLIHHNIVCGGANVNAIAFVQPNQSAIFSKIQFYNNLGENLDYGVKLKPAKNGLIRKVDIRNNIFMEVKEAVLAYHQPQQIYDTVISHNCFYNVKNPLKEDKGKTVNTRLENNLTTNPELSEIGNTFKQYYQPKNSQSPVIDAGIDVGLPFQGKAPDIGVYEY